MHRPVPATDLYNPEAKRVLDLMDRTEGGIAPGDIVDALPGLNHRYARELLGMLVSGMLATVRGTDDGDVWVVTEPGAALAAKYRDMVKSETHRPPTTKGATTMASTKQQSGKTKSTAKATESKATRTRKPSEPHPCACGCGTTLTTKSTFAQGHDARMVSQLVSAVVGHGKAAAVVPPALAKVKAEITGSGDIQHRIDVASNAVGDAFGAKLAGKANSALMNGWQNYDKPKRGAAAKQVVTAKVGRWTKQGTVDSKGRLHTKDAKGNDQIVAKGKFQVVEDAPQAS